jgi:hypothetical protein
MNTETLKKFSADLVKDFQAALLKNHTEDLVEQIKAASDASSFKVVISTSDEDRQGDTLDQTKWNLSNYKANPVVLWAHDYHSLPIGVCTGITVENGELVAEGKFASAELNPFAAQVAGLYAAGFIKATSVGFIIHEDESLELLEFSFVPVPANPYALSMREMKKLNLNMQQLVMKGLTFEVKAEQAGDACTQEDGTDGVLSEDANNPGHLVCVPSESGKAMDNDLTKSLKTENTRHGASLTKAIEEFGTKAMANEKSADETEAAFSDFNEKAATEQDAHCAYCMKAIDENYELQDQKKSVDEFKAAFQTEHDDHVKAFGKSVDEFKAAFPADASNEDKQKAIDDFTKAVSGEIDRHEKAQMGICTTGMTQDEKKEIEPPTENEKTLDEFVAKAISETAFKINGVEVDKKQLGAWATELIARFIKSGRSISAANKDKIKAVIKTVEDHHTEHGNEIQKQIAALKDLMGPDGSEGEDEKPQKTAVAPKQKVEVIDVHQPMDSFEAFMVTRKTLRTVDSIVGDALKGLNESFRKKFPDRR